MGGKFLGLMAMALIGLSGGGCYTTYSALAVSLSPAEWNGAITAEAPMRFHEDGSMLVEVIAGGHPAMALIDSGASTSIVSPDFAERISDAYPALRTGVPGSDSRFVGSLPVELGAFSINFASIGVAEPASSADLILGNQVFRQAIVDFDFEAGLVRLHDRDAFSPPTGAIELPLRFDRLYPAIEFRIDGGEPICAIIDTGSSGTLALTADTVRDHELPIDENITIVTRNINGQSYRSNGLQPLTGFELAGQTLENIRPSQRGGGPASGRRCGNLIGRGMLMGYRAIFDIADSKLWLSPRPGLVSEFELTIGVEHRRLNENILVNRVARNSPYRTTVFAGDVIVSVNGQSEFRPLPAGTPIAIVLANGETRNGLAAAATSLAQ